MRALSYLRGSHTATSAFTFAQLRTVGGAEGTRTTLTHRGSIVRRRGVRGRPGSDKPCRATFNGVYWRNLDYLGPGVLGYTPHCENARGQVIRFSMSIDSDARWYVGTGNAPKGRIDAWSVVTHEMGHATGRYGHFKESEDVCPNNSHRQTMCPGIYPGTERQCTLGAHDIHTFRNAY
jgi:hypothetical protein